MTMWQMWMKPRYSEEKKIKSTHNYGRQRPNTKKRTKPESKWAPIFIWIEDTHTHRTPQRIPKKRRNTQKLNRMIWIDLNWRAKQSIVVGCVLVALFHYSCFNSSFSRYGFYFLLLPFSRVLYFNFCLFSFISNCFVCVPFRCTFTRARVHFVRLKVWQQQCKSFDLCLWYFIDDFWFTHIFSHLILFSSFFLVESTENQGNRMLICQKV